jgi:hypothetical protein
LSVLLNFPSDGGVRLPSNLTMLMSIRGSSGFLGAGGLFQSVLRDASPTKNFVLRSPASTDAGLFCTSDFMLETMTVVIHCSEAIAQ